MRPELMEAARLLHSGDAGAADQALGLLQQTVYAFSMKVCGHVEDAEDTMQEVLYRSLKHLGKLETAEALAVWLYTVTRNRCWRMRKKGAGLEQRMIRLEELIPDEAAKQRLLISRDQSPEDLLVADEQTALLREAVRRIPIPLRLVLVLSDMEELQSEQVGAILGLKPGTVRVRLHRARLSVRKQMDEMMEERAHTAAVRDQATASQRRPSRKFRKAGKADSAQKPRKKCSPACRLVFANLSEYMDGRLATQDHARLELHMASCPACVAFLGELQLAVKRSSQLSFQCDAAVEARVKSVLSREYEQLLASHYPPQSSSASVE